MAFLVSQRICKLTICFSASRNDRCPDYSPGLIFGRLLGSDWRGGCLGCDFAVLQGNIILRLDYRGASRLQGPHTDRWSRNLS